MLACPLGTPHPDWTPAVDVVCVPAIFLTRDVTIGEMLSQCLDHSLGTFFSIVEPVGLYQDLGDDNVGYLVVMGWLWCVPVHASLSWGILGSCHRTIDMGFNASLAFGRACQEAR